MNDSDAMNALSTAASPEFRVEVRNYKVLGIAILCCALGHVVREIAMTYSTLYLMNQMHWPVRAIGFGFGLIGVALFFAFLGGLIGDRTLTRKHWVGIGLAVMAVGLFLVAMMNTQAINTGFILIGVGLLLFQGNMLVAVAEFAVAAGGKIEIAFLLVLSVINCGRIFSVLGSGFLYEKGILYPVLALLLVAAVALWLLAMRKQSSGANPDISLILNSGKQRIALLILAFVATRSVNLASIFTSKLAEIDQTDAAAIYRPSELIGNLYRITYFPWLVIGPLIVFCVIRWLHKRGMFLAGTSLIGPGLAALGLSQMIFGLGGGNSVQGQQLCLALAQDSFSLGFTLLFVGIATMTCSIVSNRWRGTLTALLAGAPQLQTLGGSPWLSWPLFSFGLLFILIGVLWHLFAARGLAGRLLAGHMEVEHESAAV